ncbi:MAG: hypothetical protein A2452_11620 [Candidatus Firestonebacteria bacterium RIFOXYC2_FULL_39_67]|nr:MAG: hypothetical protein A2536_07690 [Candidatus Firestonebacteria bacterium RIFOXYD2_FULL_39_29]OGF53871.1 MAG: hypothetical protein A2452_11620 [Candidatus Firestonebacteria bacterium RIFOXYC2_FULL_39_67]
MQKCRVHSTIWQKTAEIAVCIVVALVFHLGENAFAQKPSEKPVKITAIKLIKEKPSIKKTDKGFEISFKLEKATDVTVRIVNGKGEVVRHLASGLVGGDKAAKPFQPKSLSQNIIWDGKDDDGKNIAVNCKVSVNAGVNAKFDKFVLWEPDAFIDIGAITENSKGELYVSSKYSVHDSALRVFDKNGKYVRREWPYSPAVKGVSEFYKSQFKARGTPSPAGVPDYEGNIVPLSVNHSAAYYFYTQATGMGASPSGIVFGNWCWEGDGGVPLWVMKNGVPYDASLIRAPWAVGAKAGSREIRVAIGPEGDFYITDSNIGVLAHLNGATMEPVKSFAGDFIIKLQSPRSVAVRPNGNIWVTDNSGLTVFDKEGKVIKNNKDLNGQLGANLKTGAVYLLKGTKLQKIESSETFAVTAEVSIPEKSGQIAVDSENSIVWIMNGAGKDTLVRALDKGKSFELKIIKGQKESSVSFPMYPSVGAGKLYCASHDQGGVFVSDIDGNNFKAIFSGVPQEEGSGNSCVDSEGNYYLAIQPGWKGADSIYKYDPKGNKLKFGEKDKITVETDVKSVRGVAVGQNKDIYLSVITANTRPNEEIKPFLGKMMPMVVSRIDVYDKEGNLKEKGKVKLIDEYKILYMGSNQYGFYYHNGRGVSNGVAVARDGSIYTIDAFGSNGNPTVGKWWTNKSLPEPERWRYSNEAKLVKFPPKGGEKTPSKSDAEWEHAGVSGTAGWNCSAYECATAQIAIDEDDRVWCHDAALYNVKALDAAGNLVLRVGVYGNEDCKGGGGNKKLEGTNIVIDPEVPLSRPTGVAIWKDMLFITDEYANRIVRCNLVYADKEEVELK